MSPKKAVKTICLCVSHGCGSHYHIDFNGNQSPGVMLSSNTVRLHRLADERSKYDDPGNPTHVDIDQAHLVHGLNSLQLNHPSTLSSLSASSQKAEQPSTAYDCSRFFSFSLKSSNPSTVHTSLVAAILALVHQCPRNTISWFLNSQKDLLQLTLSRTLSAKSDELSHHVALIHEIPQSFETIISWLDLDPVMTRFACCKQCFAMYPILADTPTQCSHEIMSKPLETNASGVKHDSTPSASNIPTHDLRVCSAPLFKTRGTKNVPIRTYGFQDLHAWIAKLLSRPHIEDALDKVSIHSQIPFDPEAQMKDIQDSPVWRQFVGPQGQQFTASSDNLSFCLYTDAINAFGNRQAGKHASITFLVLICLTLPIELRYLPENIYVAGIAPGPTEPSLEQTNWILEPVVQQLKTLWNPGLVLSRTYKYPNGRRIYGALLTFLGDIPATRRILGFSSASSTHMCSYCLLTKDEITNFDSSSWPPRTTSEHRIRACESRDAKTFKEKEKIFNDHGVRYSSLLELQYWDIVSLHTVDSMHNLLLGLLKWHLHRFWAMSNVEDEPEPKGVSTRELVDLLVDAAQPSQPPVATPVSPDTREREFNWGLGWLFDLEGFDDEGYSSSDDGEFNPEDPGPDEWVPLSDSQIFMDSHALDFINVCLPRINIPSWIKQALPALGQASHGRLKADEWRTLFTIQLPLVLPLYWRVSDPEQSCLLRNFAHLVSAVNICLKRQMDSALIAKYRHHLQAYLQSSLILFEGRTFAPNHHMAIHLAECLEKFGPVRSWWTFPFERMMGRIIQACNNNHLGELEITFLESFCRLGNLRTLLSSDHLPDELKPFITQLQASPKRQTFIPRSFDHLRKNQILPPELFSQLISKINTLCLDDGCTYVASHKWHRRDRYQNIMPINARFEPLNAFHTDAQVTYSTFKTSPKNAIIQYSVQHGRSAFGRIDQIFNHSRVTINEETCHDTWIVVNRFPPIPPNTPNPFSRLAEFEVQLNACLFQPQEPQVIHISEIDSHCAWICYAADEVSPTLKEDWIVLVSLGR